MVRTTYPMLVILAIALAAALTGMTAMNSAQPMLLSHGPHAIAQSA